MNEVKVFDSSGKLKRVISPQALDIRSNQQMETPSMFKKNRKRRLPWSKSTTSATKNGTA